MAKQERLFLLPYFDVGFMPKGAEKVTIVSNRVLDAEKGGGPLIQKWTHGRSRTYFEEYHVITKAEYAAKFAKRDPAFLTVMMTRYTVYHGPIGFQLWFFGGRQEGLVLLQLRHLRQGATCEVFVPAAWKTFFDGLAGTRHSRHPIEVTGDPRYTLDALSQKCKG